MPQVQHQDQRGHGREAQLDRHRRRREDPGSQQNRRSRLSAKQLSSRNKEMDSSRKPTSGDEISPQVRRHRQDHLLRERFSAARDLHFGRKLFADDGLEKQRRHHEKHHRLLHQEQVLRFASHVLPGI